MSGARETLKFMVLAAFLSCTNASFLWKKNFSNPTDCTKNCDEWHIVIAILISTQASTEDFDNVKTFILNSVNTCLEKNEGRIAINIIDPGTEGIGPWCEEYECVEEALQEITFESSAVAVEQFSKNDSQTVMAAKTGRALLKPDIMADGRVPELLIISNYISQPFARLYDSSLNLRTNLSQVHFQLAIVGAPINYYRYNSSLSNADMQFYRDFALLAEEDDGRLCDLVTELSLTAVIAVCSAVGLIIIQGAVVFIILCYKNKRLNRRNKVLQFSVYQRGSSLRSSTHTTADARANHQQPQQVPLLGRDSEEDSLLGSVSGINSSKTDHWELKPERLEIYRDEKLGTGANGDVYKGTILGMAPIANFSKGSYVRRRFVDCTVAVKILPAYADATRRANFLEEINVMKSIEYHPNVANLLACVTLGSTICLVMEYAAFGDLAHLLREKPNVNSLPPPDQVDRSKREICLKDLLSFSWQISEGMTYLSSKKFVHRDLAARNILVDRSMNALIADFGLCLRPDRLKSGGDPKKDRLPIKWMALESLKKFEFSSKTDVWSFGVLMYEIFSLGGIPYEGVPLTEMIKYFASGQRLSRPKFASSDIYDIMTSCWREAPDERPNFESLRERLAVILEQETEGYGYLQLSQMQLGNEATRKSTMCALD